MRPDQARLTVSERLIVRASPVLLPADDELMLSLFLRDITWLA